MWWKMDSCSAGTLLLQGLQAVQSLMAAERRCLHKGAWIASRNVCIQGKGPHITEREGTPFLPMPFLAARPSAHPLSVTGSDTSLDPTGRHAAAMPYKAGTTRLGMGMRVALTPL